ncbi:MAG: OmpA family protein [Pseudomonadales bacterium]
MNTFIQNFSLAGKPLLAVVLTLIFVAGCTSTPVIPPGAADVRARLTQLQADRNLGGLVPVAIREAEAAVALAEQSVGDDTALGTHRVLMANRKVDIAEARATTRYAENQRGKLSEQRASARLDARTREADQARIDAEHSRLDAERSQANAEQARRTSAATRVAAAGAAADSEREAAKLRRQIEELKARETDRGLVLTLGDVLFDTNKSELKAGATSNLSKLVAFLNDYPERTVEIEGHTDNTGDAAYNQALSQRRADAVRNWLMQQGINSERLTASGKGMIVPIEDNSSAIGRQMNRRVEVIIASVQ